MDASPTNESSKRSLVLIILMLAGLVGGAALYYALDDTPPSREDATDQPTPLSPEEETAQRVMQLALQGARSRAAAIAQQWIAEHPDDVAVRTALAQVLASSDQPAEAEKLIDKVLSIAPDFPRACWVKGLLHADEPGRAGAWFAKAAEQDDAGAEIWGKYGLWLLRQEALDQAANYLQRAIDAGSDDPDVLRARGEIAWRNGDHANAETLLEQATKQNPRDPRNWSAWAEAQAMSGQYDAAVRTLRGGLDAAYGPARAALYLQMGDVLYQDEQYQQAAEAYAEAVQMGHMVLPALIGAARSYHRAEQYAEAMGTIDRAHKLAPEDPEVARLRKEIEGARFVQPGGLLEFNPDIDGENAQPAPQPAAPSPFRIED